MKLEDPGPIIRTVEKLYNLLTEKLSEWPVKMVETNKISVETVLIEVVQIDENTENNKNVVITWTNQDEDLGSYILGLLQNIG